MVDLHQGTINLESASGVGTVFTIHLPLMLADESQPYSAGG
jgi:signal transduction histidine kinase